jgi:hypothetical protein
MLDLTFPMDGMAAGPNEWAGFRDFLVVVALILQGKT